MTPSAAAATRSVPIEKSGVGSAVLNSARQVGGTMGVAIMGAIMAAEVGGERTPEAFMRGFETALLVAAGIAVVGAVVAYVLVRPHEGAGEEPSVTRSRTRRLEASTSATLGGRRAIHSPVGLTTALVAARQEGGHGGGNIGFPPRTENAPGCGSGGVSRSRRPLPGVASRRIVALRPSHARPAPAANPAVVPAHPIWRPIVCGVGLTIGGVSRKVK